jgi:hypothetical protein
VDALASELLEDIIPLASDYIGNVVVQKLFERGSSQLRVGSFTVYTASCALIQVVAGYAGAHCAISRFDCLSQERHLGRPKVGNITLAAWELG